jgi:hypothetical protein
MTLSYVEYISSLGLKATDGARELLQMALLADENRMVRRRDVTAERLMVPLRQCRTATTRHIRALIESGTIRLVKKNLISYYQLPEIK